MTLPLYTLLKFLIIILQRVDCFSYFIDEETEALRDYDLSKVTQLTHHNSLVYQAVSFMKSGAHNNHVLGKVLMGNRRCTQRFKKTIEKNIVVNACKISIKVQDRLNLWPLGRAPENAISHLHKLFVLQCLLPAPRDPPSPLSCCQ